MGKGREGGKSEQSAQQGTAVAVQFVTEAATEASKAELRSGARFLVMELLEHEAMQQLTMSYFCLIAPNLFKDVLHIFRIQEPNMIHMIMAFAPSIRSQD